MRWNLEKDIQNILEGYVRAQSITNTQKEKEAEKYFLDIFKSDSYFQQNQGLCGTYFIPGDSHGRACVYAMVKGDGEDTVVLIHHNDVVSVEDYKLLKEYAFSPNLLEKKLMHMKDNLPEEAKTDLEKGEYIYGRGVCDMKGGAAIQMALLKKYSEEKGFKGNVIVLGVPDEENISAGMRAAVNLLSELKDRYKLKYKLMINSEPHQRINAEEGVFSFGSIGKVMLFVYVKGFLAHAGKVFEGFNPVNVMSEIVRNTETNTALSDSVKNETSPPPTWLYLKDSKNSYDVSMPLAMKGCLSVLTLNQTPGNVLNDVKKICRNAMDKVIKDMNANYKTFLQSTEQPVKPLKWNTNVVEFKDLYREATLNYGEEFECAYREKMSNLSERVKSGEKSIVDGNYEIVDLVYDYINDLSPRVVIGFMPPYYPNVANVKSDSVLPETILNMPSWLTAYVESKYNQKYICENYYTGISDLSFSSISSSEEDLNLLKEDMPLFGDAYTIPFESIKNISMPCVNIGPWGKDFHKLTERVYKEDLLVRTPDILDYAIRKVLNQNIGD